MPTRLTQIATGEGAEHTTTEGSIARRLFPANSLKAGKDNEVAAAGFHVYEIV